MNRSGAEIGSALITNAGDGRLVNAASFHRCRLRGAELLVLLAMPVVSLSTHAAQKMNVAIAATTPLFAPYFIAIDKQYYAAEGLDVELVEAAGGVATPALLSGSLDVSTSASAASAVSAAIRGAHIKIVYTMADRLPDQLWASRPYLNTRGDSYEIALRSALDQAGLPQDWIGYSPLGFGATPRLAALISGSLPAVMLTPTDMGTALTDGSLKKSQMMIDFIKSMRLPYTGAAVSDKLLKSNPTMIEGFLRATIKGVRYALTFEPETVAILQRHNPGADPNVLLKAYRETVPTMTRVGRVSDDLIRSDLRVRAIILNMDPNRIPPIDDIYDYRLAEKVTADMDNSGWQPTR